MSDDQTVGAVYRDFPPSGLRQHANRYLTLDQAEVRTVFQLRRR